MTTQPVPPDAAGATAVTASYRDPAGFLFRRSGELLRQVNESYRSHYDMLVTSGLYEELTEAGLLVGHEEVSPALAATGGAYRVLRPELVPFVSYPFEWSFDQLRDAALLTLEIMRRAIARGMVLKDASACNVQFLRGRPVLIDTLSFECLREGEPWVAYRQFCQHFLAPLLLMAKVDVRLLGLMRQHLDGIPLDLTSGLLPRRTWGSFSTLLNVHLHARSIARHAGTAPAAASRRRVSRTALLGLVQSLEDGVRGVSWTGTETEWQAYTETHGYSPEGSAAKQEVVQRYCHAIAPTMVWDLGANTGEFSRIARAAGAYVVAFDGDPGAVQRAYRHVRDAGEERILPLLMDLTNPTPDLGWGYREIAALPSRGAPDAVLCLALIHHLALSHNLPLARIAEWLAQLARHAVVEFVPKSDPQARRLLLAREDVFADYSAAAFEDAMARHFALRDSEVVPGSERRIYHFTRH